MTCPICHHEAKELTVLKPYSDQNWIFPIGECNRCHLRFAIRDSNINYHELLHEAGGGNYDHHENFAKQVQSLLEQEKVSECEELFRKRGFIWSHLIDTVKKLPKSASILEVGCSLGYCSALLRKLGYQVHGVDISETAVHKAKDYFGDHFSTHTPADTQYDCIFHIGLIGCTDNPKEFLNTYLPLLSETGVMFFNAPDLRALKQHKLPWGTTPPPDLIYFFEPKSFESLIDTSLYTSHIESKIDPVLYAHSLLRKKQLHQAQTQFIKTDQQKKPAPAAWKRYVLAILGRILQTIWRRKVYHQYGMFVQITRK